MSSLALSLGFLMFSFMVSGAAIIPLDFKKPCKLLGMRLAN